MSDTLTLGVARITEDTHFRRWAIDRSHDLAKGAIDPQMYLIFGENNTPKVAEIGEGFFKGSISLSSREVIHIYGSNQSRFSFESPQAQRCGLLYIGSSAVQTSDLIDSWAHKRSSDLTFTVFHVVPGSKLVAGGNCFAIQYTEFYSGVEIAATVHLDSAILAACSYMKRETKFISSDPLINGSYCTTTDYIMQTHS